MCPYFVDVSALDDVIHFGSGLSMGRLYRISDDRRCGRHWSRHWEKSQSFVCSSVMEVDREVRLSLTAAT